MAQQEQEKKFIEKNIVRIALGLLVFGMFFTFLMPYVMSKVHFYDLEYPNEVGDAFGGIANPVATFIGVILTFFAFYVQYLANERQTIELEKQKRNVEYRFIQESINNLKDDIMALRYTKESVTYSHSEAIWKFMIDGIDKTNIDEGISLPKQQYFQIAYMLTLFEPLINEIDNCKLEEKEKHQMLTNVDGLFESSFSFISRLYENLPNESRDSFIKTYVKRKIIIPVKRIKIELKEVLNKYKEPEKEIFISAVEKMRGIGFIRQIRYNAGRGAVVFYKNYQEFKQDKPTTEVTEKQYETYFEKEDQITKTLITEPVRLLMKLDFLRQINFEIPCNHKYFSIDLDRTIIENYFDLDLAELKIDKDLWRDNFLGKFVYDDVERLKFMDKFCRIKVLE